MRECVLTGNEAEGGGGAIYSSDGNLTVLNSTFTGNNAGGAGAYGGGIYVIDTSGTDPGVTIADSTFTGNEVTKKPKAKLKG